MPSIMAMFMPRSFPAETQAFPGGFSLLAGWSCAQKFLLAKKVIRLGILRQNDALAKPPTISSSL